MNGDEPLLKDTGRGLNLNYRGKNLYSSLRAPGRGLPAGRRGPGARTACLVLVPGYGLGYGLEVLLSRLPAGSSLLCVETDPKLQALVAAFPPPRDPRLAFAASLRQSLAAVRALGLHRFRRVQVVALCGSYHLDRSGYDAILQSLEEEIRQFWQNRITLAHMSRLWLRNLFANLASAGFRGPGRHPWNATAPSWWPGRDPRWRLRWRASRPSGNG